MNAHELCQTLINAGIDPAKVSPSLVGVPSLRAPTPKEMLVLQQFGVVQVGAQGESLNDQLNKQPTFPWYVWTALGFGVLTMVVAEFAPRR